MKEIISIDVNEKVNKFLDMTLPKDASEIQIRETRKAFIAGMYQTKCDMLSISSLDEDFADDYMKEYTKNINKAVENTFN